MNRTSAWKLVAKREVVVKLTDKSFLYGTLLTLVVIIGTFGFQAFEASKTQTFTVAATTADRSMADSVATAAPGLDAKTRITVAPVTDEAAARTRLADGDADAWLHEGDNGWVLTSQSETDPGLEDVARQAVAQSVLKTNAEAVGTSVADLQAGTVLTTDLVRGDAQKAQVTRTLSLAMAFLFYFSAVMFGVTLANSVVEEKQSRVVEIIATSIRVPQLLAGKVIGNTVLAVGQMAVYVAVGLIGVSFTTYSSFLPAVSAGLGWFLVFFVTGFVVIACLFAVAGALSSRAEDVQTTSTPITMLLMVMFFGSFFLHGTAQVVASYVPPMSALLMPARVVSGTAQWWEPVIAVVLLLVAAAVVVAAASRLYRRSLLQTQGRMSIKAAWRAET